jgi:hypothetical protein
MVTVNGTESLSAKVGVAAHYTVKEPVDGGPRFRTWKPFERMGEATGHEPGLSDEAA